MSLLGKQRLNLYQEGAALFWTRLKWDLRGPVAWKNRQKLRRLKDCREGEKAVILCNGPSLIKTDFELLKTSNVFTIGMNKIYLLKDSVDFDPDLVVCFDHRMIRECRDEFAKFTQPLFLSRAGVHEFGAKTNVHYLDLSNQICFPKDISMSVYHGATTTYGALLIAYYFGFSEVALVGCDHNWNHAKVEKETGSTRAVMGEKDESHFHPDYFTKGTQFIIPNVVESEFSYRMARSAFEESGRRLVNATTGGQLEIFERMSLSDFLA